ALVHGLPGRPQDVPLPGPLQSQPQELERILGAQVEVRLRPRLADRPLLREGRTGNHRQQQNRPTPESQAHIEPPTVRDSSTSIEHGVAALGRAGLAGSTVATGNADLDPGLRWGDGAEGTSFSESLGT